MQTKLGISSNLLGAFIFIMGLLSVTGLFGTLALPMLIVVAYILLKEEDLTLKTMAATSSFLVLFYFVVDRIFDFVPEFLNFLNFFLQFAKIYITDGYGIVNFLFLLVTWTIKVFFIILMFMAFSGKTIRFGFITKHIR